MTNGTPTDGEELSEEERRAVVEVCEAHDFPLAEARLDGDLLRLTPESLDDLPDAHRLNAIADALEERDFGFVTFNVPGPRDEEST